MRGRLAGFAGLVLALGGAVGLDPVVHHLAFRHLVGHEVRLLANGLTHLGTAWAGGGILGAVAAAGYRAGDRALLRAGLGGAAGVALGGAGTEFLKQLVCRGRPSLYDGWGTEAPEPAARGAAARQFFHWPCWRDPRFQGFPSGHAATAFAVAGTLTRLEPGLRPAWLVAASAVAGSRILLNAHFLSDVLVGGLLGWGAARWAWTWAGRWLPVGADAPVGPGGPYSDSRAEAS